MQQTETFECDAHALHDELCRLEALSWRIIRVTQLPAGLGWRITAERERQAEPRPVRLPYKDDDA